MSENWDEHAKIWDSRNDVQTYSKLAFESLCQHHNPEYLNVLDFGCGTGLLTEKIAAVANTVIAIDSSQAMIAVLENKNLTNVEAIVCEISQDSINENPSLTSGFDLIVASSVCNFLPDLEKTLSDLKSLLVPGGLFIQWDWQRSDADSDFGFTREQILASYENVGLNAVSVSQAFSLSIPNGNSMNVLIGIARNA
ncbi:MAG: class I SAM-dependent methyltransferase [Pseudomonadales bacterium]|nr:class I SAM-dependent methyltransferase [Pseudomonadales bacterium]